MQSISSAKALAINSPRPEYPYEARSRHIMGSGVCVVSVDASGNVTDATMVQSIGNPILDNSAVSAFRRWRFKPGVAPKVKIPITFTMTGASY
jgi:protein TonB